MFIKVKCVKLKNGKTATYYYLAESYREGKQVKQKIIKYLGKEIPEEYTHFKKHN